MLGILYIEYENLFAVKHQIELDSKIIQEIVYFSLHLKEIISLVSLVFILFGLFYCSHLKEATCYFYSH